MSESKFFMMKIVGKHDKGVKWVSLQNMQIRFLVQIVETEWLKKWKLQTFSLITSNLKYKFHFIPLHSISSKFI